MRRYFLGSSGRSPALIWGAALAALLTFGGAQTASAQILADNAVAIVDFRVTRDGDTADLGKLAADSIRTECAASATSDEEIIPGETVARAMENLGFALPPIERTQLMRLGMELDARTIVRGEVVDWRIIEKDGGRVAIVAMRVFVHDVASGLTVNGSGLSGETGVRPEGTDDATMYRDAMKQAAFDAVNEIRQRKLPSATVLNTLNESALINKGGRSGFVTGMQIIVVRGSDQVATAVVGDVSPGSAFINITRTFKGVQPGDKVRVLFTVPEVGLINPEGIAQTRRSSRVGGSNSGLVSLLVVLVLLAFLLGQGRGGNAALIAGVTSEAIVQANDIPGVKISWKRDAFLRGNLEGPWQWQIFRDDPVIPVAVADGVQGFIVDDALGTAAGFWFTMEPPSFGECRIFDDLEQNDPLFNGVVAGTPYQYSVRVIYRVDANSLPGDASTGGQTTGGQTTGGQTTGGQTTGTTGTTGTGGTGGGGQEGWCYFASTKVFAKGLATPLARSELRSPDNDQIITTPLTFQFTSVRGGVPSVILEYVVQLSDSPGFPTGRTITLDPFVELVEPGGQTVSSPTIDTSTFLPGATLIYWRVGARNTQDFPGPVRDASGIRYVFSGVRRFKRTGDPPDPPLGE